MSTAEKIKHFVGIFERQLSICEGLNCKGANNLKLQKKILYVAVIDAMSKSVYPRRKNRERFTSFIQRFAEWKDGERVSLPHLLQLLALTPDPEFEKLRAYVRSEISKWASISHVHLGSDPNLGEMRKLWPRLHDQQIIIEGIDLERLQHINLLYLYRNSLIHEFRAAGTGIEFKDDTAPYYMSYDEFDENDKVKKTVWELVYPVQFFREIAANCLKNLEKYLKDNDLNPLSSYDLGTYWVKGLNVEDS